MYVAERVIRDIMDSCLESFSLYEEKTFITERLNEMSKDDLDEILDELDFQRETNIFEKIEQWHLDRKITVNGNSMTQTVKLGEEFGELCSGIVRQDKELITDSIGDCVVVLSAIAKLEGFILMDCIESSYNEIKDRTGTLNENGNWIKDNE